jgi:hypothetical protein
MKKIAIGADNYKVNRFKKELTKAGFTDFSISPFTPDVSLISVNVEDDKVNEVNKICQKIELHFKRSN